MKNNEKEKIGKLILGYRKAKILFVAVSLGVFSLTREAGSGFRRVARLLGVNQRAMEIFLDALAATGFLEKKSGFYRNTEITGRFLVPESPEYLGHNLIYQNIIWDAWSGLEEVLKTGKPRFPLRSLLSEREDFLRGYIRGMGDIAVKPAAEIAEIIGFSGPGKILDVGGGPGAYAAAFLKRNKNLRGVILDLPETLGITRGLFKKDPVLERLSFQEGDYHKTFFGKNKYDIVLFSNVTHDEGPEENLALFRKAFSALRRGGRVIAHDFMLDETGTSPEFAALFSVHMLVYTNKGRVYSEKEYGKWIKKAGFTALFSREICRGSDNSSRIIVGKKP